ncbi:uncharacterized protein [Narcine bancroftii]|uniref:uncharacterized protein n=1 Tax=Narcine bancroftii TaxID=1343680 RepID=UPI003831DDE7
MGCDVFMTSLVCDPPGRISKAAVHLFLKMSANWGYKEVQELLILRAADEINRYITGTVKDGPIFERLAQQLRDRGFVRDKAQVISKLKSLRRKFNEVNDHNGRSGRGRLDWPHFDLCYSIWGASRTTSLLDLPSDMEDPAPQCPAPQDPVPQGPAPQDEAPPETITAVSPSCSSCSDAGVPSGMETDASIKNSESVSYSRPGCLSRQKRKKPTKAQLVTKEIKDLLLAMHREDEKRDRLRFERQRVHEEQLRREVQEAEMAAREVEMAAREADRRERADQMNVFANMFRDIQYEMQNQTSLLRDLIALMPAPVPQHPAPTPQPQTPANISSLSPSMNEQKISIKQEITE